MFSPSTHTWFKQSLKFRCFSSCISQKSCEWRCKQINKKNHFSDKKCLCGNICYDAENLSATQWSHLFCFGFHNASLKQSFKIKSNESFQSIFAISWILSWILQKKKKIHFQVVLWFPSELQLFWIKTVLPVTSGFLKVFACPYLGVPSFSGSNLLYIRH